MINKHWTIGGLVMLLFVMAMLGGSWGASYGEGLNQGTVPTATPSLPPPPTATQVPPTANPTQAPSNPTATPRPRTPPAIVPLIFIDEVVCDQKVTLHTANFPANQDFRVRMNNYGTRGVGGVQVATVNSLQGGRLAWTFDIPTEMKGLDRIAIRLESSQGYYSFNWFWNPCGSSQATPVPGSGTVRPFGIPRFTITAVTRDKTVTMVTQGFPANDSFVVRMNTYGTRGIGGEQIDTVETGPGGELTFTFKIPDRLKGLQRIAIRFDSPNSGYYSYNWFWNNTHP